MEKDKELVEEIIKEMLYSPDKNGTYDMVKARDKLETLINDRRVEAIGWAYADCCTDLDKGLDPRKTEMPGVLERSQVDLSK